MEVEHGLIVQQLEILFTEPVKDLDSLVSSLKKIALEAQTKPEFRLFTVLCPQVIYLMQQSKHTAVSGEDKLQESEDTELMITGLVILLECLGKLSQDVDNGIRECLFKEGIIATCISLLFQADQTLPRVTKAVSTFPNSQDGATGFSYIKRNIVKVIGNMSFENKIVQDEVRELGGIPLVLNQCNIDDNNPYIREQAIFAIRSLLVGNPDNQKFVDELQPVGAVQNDILREIHVKAELRKDGKVKLVADHKSK
ncbi:12145_t:CDS:2 [Acaulospora colombiana]|uniref:12145_t:CDS:1 n=1 Tax=Acaulospora colombiana TaxID=27376 RepID=A0ACA9KD71_9GLOM|nr:12145_t:CDS:2 [Acaulospora colombiana]